MPDPFRPGQGMLSNYGASGGTSFGSYGGNSFVMGTGSLGGYGRQNIPETNLSYRNSPNFGAMAANVSNVATGAGGILGAAGKVGSFLTAAAPAIGVIGAIAGFVGSISARRRARREARRRKKRAIKTENMLIGAAENVVKDIAVQKGFADRAFRQQQGVSVSDYQDAVEQGTVEIGRTGLAGSGAGQRALDRTERSFELSQERSQFARESEAYGLEQQELSRLRDIQGNLLELSSYSGRNINILNMMGRG
tara:strand:+ start:6989 stop:7741 length:753 start_codon:yes stop_codon:yes gene_type:complete